MRDPKLVILDINRTLSPDSFHIFRKLFIRLKSNRGLDAEIILEELLRAFFNSTIRQADPTSAFTSQAVPEYAKRKELIEELRGFIPRKNWTRYDRAFSDFFQKYETFQATKFDKRKAVADLKTVMLKRGKKEKKPATVETDEVCMICGEQNDLHVSKCKHYACLYCWERWLANYLECPMCKTRLRRHQILPLRDAHQFLTKAP